jgi:hypothetical protein
MKQIANADARSYVENCTPFKGSNLWGEVRVVDQAIHHEVYVVYSYGQHYPMWVYDGEIDQWYGNHDRYSRTTSKHRTQTQPLHADIKWYDTQTMIQLSIYGYRGMASNRILYGRRAA